MFLRLWLDGRDRIADSSLIVSRPYPATLPAMLGEVTGLSLTLFCDRQG